MAVEGIWLHFQYHSFLTPKQAETMLFGRFINTRGNHEKRTHLVGETDCNVPADLEMEHRNKSTKKWISTLVPDRNKEKNCQ